MNLSHRAVVVCWTVFYLYWLVSSRSVKPTLVRVGLLRGNWLPILLLIGLLFMVNFKFLARLGIGAALAIPLLPNLPVMNAAGIVFLVSGLVLAIIARKKLADNWSAAVVIKVDHELITTGIYHRIRHPIYSGIMLMATGTSLSIGTTGALLAFLVIGLAIWLKLSREEMLLTEHFGAEYEEYKKHTKKLIPYIW